MSKGSDSNLNFLKTQNCVLKVNICCDGCKIKVKKLLQKIDGVYTISIDSEKGKVTVSGSASPATLIKKLCKAGKHAELLGPRSGNSTSNNFQEQLQKLQLQQKVNGNPTKNGAGGGGGGGGKEQKKGLQGPKMPQMKDLKLAPQKDEKNAKFTFPSEDEDGSSFDDEEDDMYDSEDSDGYDYDDLDTKKKPVKEKGGGGKKESHGGGGGCGHKDGENGGDKNKKGAPNGNKKGGGATTGGAQPKTTMGGQGTQGMNTGTMTAPVGHPMSLSAGGMPPGYYQGGMAAQQQQQQYMAAMQQRMMMNGPMQYGQQPTMGYSQPMGQMMLPAPPAYGEPGYAHYFSDENPSSCSVM